jgi:hypothetical protein
MAIKNQVKAELWNKKEFEWVEVEKVQEVIEAKEEKQEKKEKKSKWFGKKKK